MVLFRFSFANFEQDAYAEPGQDSRNIAGLEIGVKTLFMYLIKII
jgi:hypothetical protein